LIAALRSAYFDAKKSGTKIAPKPGTHASGAFDVALTPVPTTATADVPALGRMTAEKHYHGDLDATAKGEMLSAGTDRKDSAGYVAIEYVSGTLNGRKGTFLLQHDGTLTRGAQRLTVTVVPDSGTGELTGLAGTMTIVNDNGQHSYEFDYTLGGTR
jgi:hypothetical protein